jgi:hypothetical protein
MVFSGSKSKWFRLLLLSLFVVFGIGLLSVWRGLLPETKSSLSMSLSAEDQRQVARVCRDETVRLCARKLRDGEIRNFVSIIPKLLKQRIHRFIADNDGTYRAYVGYPDKASTDGYGDLWRHQLMKTNGDWKVVRSY